MIKKSTVIFIIFTITTQVNFSKSRRQSRYPYVIKIVQDACSIEQQNQKIHLYTTLINRLKDKRYAKKAVESSAYISCFLEYPTFLSSIGFNLANFAFQEGIKKDIIVNTIGLLSIHTYGKDEFLKYAKLWEHLKNTGLENKFIKNIFYKAMTNGYRGTTMEGLSIIYLSQRQKNKNHEEALKIALKQTQKFKRSRSKKRVFKEIIKFEENLKISAPFSEANLNPPPSEFNDEYWKQLENKLKQQKRIRIKINKIWNATKLNKFINQWKNTPFKYGGNSKKGIDNYFFIQRVIESQFPYIPFPSSLKELAEQGKSILRPDIQTGDIIFFNVSSEQNQINFAGIYLGKNKIVLVTKKQGVTVLEFNNKYYQSKIVRIQRITN